MNSSGRWALAEFLVKVRNLDTDAYSQFMLKLGEVDADTHKRLCQYMFVQKAALDRKANYDRLIKAGCYLDRNSRWHGPDGKYM